MEQNKPALEHALSSQIKNYMIHNKLASACLILLLFLLIKSFFGEGSQHEGSTAPFEIHTVEGLMGDPVILRWNKSSGEAGYSSNGTQWTLFKDSSPVGPSHYQFDLHTPAQQGGYFTNEELPWFLYRIDTLTGKSWRASGAEWLGIPN